MTQQNLIEPVEEEEQLEAATVEQCVGADGNGGCLIVNCDGGLGNQMFEYAAGVYFAREFGRSLEVMKPILKQQQWNGYRRPFQLSEFRIAAPVREAGVLDRVMVSRSDRTKRLRRVVGRIVRAEVLAEPQAYTWQSNQISRPSRPRAYLLGYWQAAAYADAVSSSLRREFTLRSEMRKRNCEYAELIGAMKCPVSLHVRLGDYTKIRHETGCGTTVSQVLSRRYYERTLEVLKKSVSSSYTLVVFSDDPDQARLLLKDVPRTLFIEGNGAEAAHEEMMLMSLCRHHVVANSSFSWWGAWLNASKEKRVFAPRFWGNTADSFFPDLYPAGWETVNNL